LLSEAKIDRRPVLTQATYTPRPTSRLKTNASRQVSKWHQSQNKNRNYKRLGLRYNVP